MTNDQIPMTKEAPNDNQPWLPNANLGAWKLAFHWSLVLGHWSFGSSLNA
jgi:hypothetical protein